MQKNLNALSIKILSIWRMDLVCDSELRKIQKHGYTDLGLNHKWHQMGFGVYPYCYIN